MLTYENLEAQPLQADWEDGETVGFDCLTTAGCCLYAKVYVIFSVQDTGRGLSDAEHDLLFTRFSQASPRTHIDYGNACPWSISHCYSNFGFQVVLDLAYSSRDDSLRCTAAPSDLSRKPGLAVLSHSM